MKTVANGRISVAQDALRQQRGVSVYWFAKFDWRSGTQYYALRDFIPDPAVSVKPIILNYPTIDRAMPVGLGNQGMSNAASITLMNLPHDVNRIELLLETNSDCIVGTQVSLYLAYKPAGALAEADWILENIYRIQGYRTGTNTVTFDLVDWVLGKGGVPVTNVLTETLFPYADETVVGQVMPHVFGSLRNVPTIPVSIGPSTQLDGAITAEATTVWVDGPLSNIKWPPSGGGRIQVGDEQIDFNSVDFDEMRLLDCVRGANGTVAIEHSDRSAVRLIRRGANDILAVFLVADHICEPGLTGMTNMRIGGKSAGTKGVSWNEAVIVGEDGRSRHVIYLLNAAVPTYQAPSGSATTDKFSGDTYWSNDGSSAWVEWQNAIDEEAIGTGCTLANIPEAQTLGLGFDQDMSARNTAIKNARLVVDYSILTAVDFVDTISWPWPKVHLERTGLDTQYWDLPKPSDEELRARLQTIIPDTKIEVPGAGSDDTTSLFKHPDVFRLGAEQLRIDTWVAPAGAYPNEILPYVLDGQRTTGCPWEIVWWDFTDVAPDHPYGVLRTTHIWSIGLIVSTLPYLGDKIYSATLRALYGDDDPGGNGSWVLQDNWPSGITQGDFNANWLGKYLVVYMPGLDAADRSIQEIWVEISYTRQPYPGALFAIESNTPDISPEDDRKVSRPSAINLTKEFDITEIVRNNGEWDYFDNTVRVAIHHSTSDPASTSETEIMIKDVRIEIDHLAEETQIGIGKVTVDVEGRHIDTTLIETPGYVILTLITHADYFGIDVAYVDSDSLTSALSLVGTSTLNFGRFLNESASARQLLYQAAECAGIRVVWDAGMFRFSPILPVTMPEVAATGHSVVRNELWTEVAKNPLSVDLAANRLDLKFVKENMTPGIVQVPDPESGELTPSQELPWGILPKELSMPWLKITEQVQNVGQILLAEVEFPRTRIRVASSLGLSHLEIGDPISITDVDSRMASGTPGRVCGLKYEGNNKTSLAMLSGAGLGRVIVWEDTFDKDNFYIALNFGSQYMDFVVGGDVVARLTAASEWRIKGDLVLELPAATPMTDYIERDGTNVNFGMEDVGFPDIKRRMIMRANGDLVVRGINNWALFGTDSWSGSFPGYIQKDNSDHWLIFSNNGIYVFSSIFLNFLGCREVVTNVEF